MLFFVALDIVLANLIEYYTLVAVKYAELTCFRECTFINQFNA